ncbi:MULTISPECIES: ATP-binding protein [Streptomyces]|uniref:ATP-binding protein n=1 Tax=Streptomyces TaxID=1883 RepID=UPI0033A55C1E
MQEKSARLRALRDTASAKLAPVKTVTAAARLRGTNTLDALSPLAAPLAARWDAEADRRMQLRTPEHLKALMKAQSAHTSARSTAATAKSQRSAARSSSKNPFSTARRAAATADRAATASRHSARAALKTAKADYPATLTATATRAHVAHLVPAGVASWALSTPADWATWPASLSIAVVAANAGALWLGRRGVSVTVEDGVSAEERRLLERLDPSYWVQHAHDRGLSGTLTEHPEMTPAGIVCGVRLDDKWTAPKFGAETEGIRALLGMKTETRMQISRGTHGDRAQIVIRTRSAADGVSMIWTPEHTGIGVDEVTGELVDLPLRPGTHILLAGRTGMGKSVSWRPLMMRAVLSPDWTGVVIDPKRQEAIGWQHCLRTVGQETDREERLARIYATIRELTWEMHRRQGMATGSVWTPDGRPENRFLLVVIDEGAALVRMSKDKRYKDALDLLEELWAEARSVGFQFIWATQFPTKAVGVPAAVKENMSAFLSLTVNAGEAERAIFGETAQQTGWLPSRLDGVPGRALLQFQTRGTDPVRLWHVTDGTIKGLPKADPWVSPAALPEVPAPDGPRLQLVKDAAKEPAESAAVPAAPKATNRDRVFNAIQEHGPITRKGITDATGVKAPGVSKAVKALISDGLVIDSDGALLPAPAQEASA